MRDGRLAHAEGELLGEELCRAADVLKAMAHPLRLRLLCGLLATPSTLTEMGRVLGVPHSTLAQHLNVLRRAGIIQGSRQGRDVRFVVADPRASQIMGLVCTRLSAPPEGDPSTIGGASDHETKP